VNGQRQGPSDPGRGLFIALEGGEASGKSTQAELLAARLGALCTREPGGTDLGRRVRSVVLDPDVGAVDPRAEALLLAADRAQHVSEVIAPALAAGTHVVTDRFTGSTLAYQGYGRGLDLDALAKICSWATDGLEPDLVVLLDVDPATAVRRQGGRPLDRLEGSGDEFHQRVRLGYLALAAADPARWAVVKGDGAVDEVAALVWRVVAEVAGARVARGPKEAGAR
jgi:dTMP kinase